MIWIGTYPNAGLSKFNRSPKAFACYRYNSGGASGLSDRVVTSIYVEPNPHSGQSDIIWMGTRHGGLKKFDHVVTMANGEIELSPFWKTWWFWALCLLGTVLTLALLHEHRVKQRIKSFWKVEQARKQENEQIRRQVARDFHDEFGCKLTNILLFTEILKQNLRATSPQDLEYLNKISDASQSLSMGIRDFIWTLDPQKDSLYDVAVRLKDFGDALYSNAGIDFYVKGIDKKHEEVGMSMPWRRYLTLIFKESMGYMAHQPECKSVTLEIACEQKNVALTLAYAAANFDGDQEHLTHWGEMKKYAHEIGGELMITSNPKGEHRMQFLGKIP
jgi:glucose-6-phosphate-specific signal transduction histidine kinase